jgi:hypothetical protein
MKKLSFLIPLCLLAISISLACTKSPADSDRTSFGVTESDDSFEISAEYNKSKITQVQKAVNDYTKPVVVFNSETDNFAKTITLADNSKIYVKTSQGKLLIKLNRKENSSASFQRVKGMVPSIKAAVE